jgi:hypothetical protein
LRGLNDVPNILSGCALKTLLLRKASLLKRGDNVLHALLRLLKETV